MHRLAIGLLAGVAVAALSSLASAQDQTELPPLGPDDLVFSVENMDTSVDPAVDFYRYAAGKWLDRVDRPARLPCGASSRSCPSG